MDQHLLISKAKAPAMSVILLPTKVMLRSKISPSPLKSQLSIESNTIRFLRQILSQSLTEIRSQLQRGLIK